MAVTRVQVVVPFHLALAASEAEIEAAGERVYGPILDAISAAPRMRVALHFTGHLLDVMSRRQSPVLAKVKALVSAGQAEVLGGLFYGAVPALQNENDLRGQIEMMTEYWESALGAPPTSFWLPELAWCDELPRLLEETGLGSGFVSSSQVNWPSAGRASLVRIERGGRGIAAFVLDQELSAAAHTETAAAFVQRLLLSYPGQLASLWLRAEALGLEPGTYSRCFEARWLAEWIQAITGAEAELEPVLPAAALGPAKPALPVRLRPELAAELGARGILAAAPSFSDFVAESTALDTLYRRMLRVSDRLREAIDTMEADGLEDSWSDVLATAQRLVFAAQAPDLFWRGRGLGFDDPRLRDAVSDRLCEAEAMIDQLVQGEEDWIAVEEEDRDGDLLDEVFVSNRHLAVWISTAQGGWVRSLEDRDSGRNVLDVDGAGISERLLPADVNRAEAMSPDRAQIPPTSMSTAVDKSEIDEEGDGTYHLETKNDLQAAGVRPLAALVRKSIEVPIDRAELTLTYDVSGNAIVAVEMPVRLGSDPVELAANGAPVAQDAELVEVERLKVRALSGTVLELVATPPLDMWVAPAAQPAGVDCHTGLWITALIRPDRAPHTVLKLTLSGDAAEAPPEASPEDVPAGE
ncbi:MAG: hypothetical protein HY903_19590 [Deltaproteobacteria bacterium]|nr:hypothetical protein [Deltaproteobacteria bacterium]